MIFFTTLCIAKNYEINVNFESGFEYKSQEEFVNQLQFLRSTREIEYLISNQDWIKDYSLRYKPFRKEVFISIKNRSPIFILNKEFFYDEELNKFNFDFRIVFFNTSNANKSDTNIFCRTTKSPHNQ